MSFFNKNKKKGEYYGEVDGKKIRYHKKTKREELNEEPTSNEEEIEKDEKREVKWSRKEELAKQASLKEGDASIKGEEMEDNDLPKEKGWRKWVILLLLFSLLYLFWIFFVPIFTHDVNQDIDIDFSRNTTESPSVEENPDSNEPPVEEIEPVTTDEEEENEQESDDESLKVDSSDDIQDVLDSGNELLGDVSDELVEFGIELPTGPQENEDVITIMAGVHREIVGSLDNVRHHAQNYASGRGIKSSVRTSTRQMNNRLTNAENRLDKIEAEGPLVDNLYERIDVLRSSSDEINDVRRENVPDVLNPIIEADNENGQIFVQGFTSVLDEYERPYRIEDGNIYFE